MNDDCMHRIMFNFYSMKNNVIYDYYTWQDNEFSLFIVIYSENRIFYTLKLLLIKFLTGKFFFYCSSINNYWFLSEMSNSLNWYSYTTEL